MLVVAVIAIVDSMASPSAPPTCWVVFSTPEASPASLFSTLETAARVSGMNVKPSPVAITTLGRSRPET